MLDRPLPPRIGLEPISAGIRVVRRPAELLAPNEVAREPFLADPLARHSPTRGACALFLRESTAFPRERLFVYILI